MNCDGTCLKGGEHCKVLTFPGEGGKVYVGGYLHEVYRAVFEDPITGEKTVIGPDTKFSFTVDKDLTYPEAPK